MMKECHVNRQYPTGMTELVRRALSSELFLSVCCQHLSGHIHNGRIKRQFIDCAEAAQRHHLELRSFLAKDDPMGKFPGKTCDICQLKPESFSLSGALNLCLEVTDKIILLYKELIKISERKTDCLFFEKLVKEKSRQRQFFKKEAKFDHNDEDFPSKFIDDFCIPRMISLLNQ